MESMPAPSTSRGATQLATFSESVREWAPRLIPGTTWIRRYRRRDLPHDVVAGLTLAAVIVPIGMAYGQLSGLPPITGLYASLLPLIAYALFGSSRQLIIGPDASSTALMAAAIAPLAAGNVARALDLAALLAILVGAFALLGALLHLGFIASFLSRPILVGYMNGLVLIVIAAQLGKTLGISIQSDAFVGQALEALSEVGTINWPTAAIGVGVFSLILLLRRVAPRLPAALLAVVLATFVVAVFHLETYGVATLGAVPGGLPHLHLPRASAGDIGRLTVDALGIALLTFSDTILNSRSFARRNGYDVDANGELRGLAVANLAAGISQGYPVSASGARTAVNEAAGGKTQLVALVAALTLAGILLWLTPVLADFPVAALGGALIAAVLPLIDVASLRQMYRIRKADLVVAAVTFVGVLAIGLLEGIALAVGLSLLLVLLRAVRPHDAVLGQVEGVDGFHDVDDYTDAETIPGLIVYRFDAPLFFANAERFQSRILELVRTTSTPVEWVLLDAEAITDLDSTAAETLERLHAELAQRGVVLAIARAKRALRNRLTAAGLTATITEGYFFPSIRSGVAAFQARRMSFGP
jgi:sulfate permease, SulP family